MYFIVCHLSQLNVQYGTMAKGFMHFSDRTDHKALLPVFTSWMSIANSFVYTIGVQVKLFVAIKKKLDNSNFCPYKLIYWHLRAPSSFCIPCLESGQ